MPDDDTMHDRDPTLSAPLHQEFCPRGQFGIPAQMRIICDRVPMSPTTGMRSDCPLALLGPYLRLPGDKVALRRGQWMMCSYLLEFIYAEWTKNGVLHVRPVGGKLFGECWCAAMLLCC